MIKCGICSLWLIEFDGRDSNDEQYRSGQDLSFCFWYRNQTVASTLLADKTENVLGGGEGNLEDRWTWWCLRADTGRAEGTVYIKKRIILISERL